jgi:C1A family cysteine protease
MRLRLLLIILISAICMIGYSQEDPMAKIKRSKEDKAKDEQKLNEKGKAEFAKAQADHKKLQGATFDIAANEILNGDLKSLVGVPPGKPDTKLSEKQNEDNVKNQKDINDKVKKDSKNDKADLNFSATGTPPVGASWTDSYYWTPSYYTPVKNQGGCGSCWAFAACAAFEHTYAKLYGSKLDLSEQDVVACGQTCGLWGLFKEDCGSCGGGWSDKAFDYMKCTGVASESSYLYTATSGPCYSKPRFKSANTWGQVSYANQRDWIKYYITIYGSVVTYMKAGIGTFYSYGGGAYNGYPNTNSGDIDHAVTIVGWYEPWSAWIIKNSWGTGWGPYGGYAYVRYDNCNIGNYVYWIYPKP